MTKSSEPNISVEDYTHYHRTCQNCGKNWRGLHCPHDSYQNPCPECGSVPVVVNAHYCDCEFVIPVPDLHQLLLSELPEKKNTWDFKHLSDTNERIASANAHNKALKEIQSTYTRLFRKETLND